MKNIAHQLKKIGITLLCFIGGLILVWAVQFIDHSGGLTLIFLIADVVICGIAILYFFFLILVPPSVLEESTNTFKNERSHQLYGAGNPSTVSTSNTGTANTGRYDKLVLGISFLFFLGLLAVARKQINIGPYSGYRAISDAIGPWFWWPLLGVGLMLLGGGQQVIYKDQYGRLWEGQTNGGTGSLSLLLGFLLSFILIYFSLAVRAYWFQIENFPVNPHWITWIIAIAAFLFFGIAFTYLFKARSRRSHILLYVVMGILTLLSRM